MIPLTSSKIGSKFQKTDKFVKSAVWSVNHYFFVENSLAVEFRGTWRGLMSLNSATPLFRQSGTSVHGIAMAISKAEVRNSEFYWNSKFWTSAHGIPMAIPWAEVRNRHLHRQKFRPLKLFTLLVKYYKGLLGRQISKRGMVEVVYILLCWEPFLYTPCQ